MSFAQTVYREEDHKFLAETFIDEHTDRAIVWMIGTNKCQFEKDENGSRLIWQKVNDDMAIVWCYKGVNAHGMLDQIFARGFKRVRFHTIVKGLPRLLARKFALRQVGAKIWEIAHVV